MPTYFSPAKINLNLVIHEKIDTGYHLLSSIIVGLSFGDMIEINQINGSQDIIECNDQSVPIDHRNLISKAMLLLRERLDLKSHFLFKINKNIPCGAGYGGGSSNAITAVKAVLEITNLNIPKNELLDIASKIGSDCAFFLNPKPSIMGGTGEIIHPIEKVLKDQLIGLEVLLYKPEFSISTKFAYKRLTNNSYKDQLFFKNLLNDFSATNDYRKLIFNSFSKPILHKYISLNILLSELNSKMIPSLISGSGSGCFSLLLGKNNNNARVFLKKKISDAFGPKAFIREAKIL